MYSESTLRNNEEPTVTVYVRVGSETIAENQKLRADDGDYSFSVTSRKIKSRRHPCIRVQITESEAAAFAGNIETLDENEAAAEDRERRCRLPDPERKGGTIMCPERHKCHLCTKPGHWNFDNLHDTSIEGMRFPDADTEQPVDDNIPDPRDEIADIETDDFERVLEEKLWAINPVYAEIFHQMYLGNLHPIGISRALGIPKTSAYRYVTKVRALAQEFYQEMNS